MTFLEKLKIEHPEKVSKMCGGGAIDCPCSYNYEPEQYCAYIHNDCTACWNREMPETEDEETSFEKKREELYAWCKSSKCEECPIYKIVDFVEVCDFESMPEKRLDDLYEAIHAAEKKTEPEAPAIKDSGNRREFATGAVRDIQEGKGRMDLLPWAAIIEVSKHCENGAKKYGEHNVDKGIPLHSLCDSAARHFAKFMDGQIDEDHLLAAAWNLLWAVEMRLKKPEMCDVPWKEAEKMTNEKLQKMFDEHKKWVNGEGGKRADLSGSDLSNTDLRGFDLSHAVLSHTNLNHADLRRSVLCNTNLSHANLSGANLDYSCWPLWSRSLDAHIDTRIAVQLLYHLMRPCLVSHQVDDEFKKALFTPELVEWANKFHRAEEYGEIELPEEGEHGA